MLVVRGFERLFAGAAPVRLAFGCSDMVGALRRVLARGIETGGASISDYVAPDGSDGRYQDERRVYSRTGEPCRACGAPIRRRLVGQRSTHWCPRCQR